MTLIPSGTFLMGAPEHEPKRRRRERPQHLVKVPSFFMGTYPITQAEWRIVASFEQVNLPLNPEPSEFGGDRHPVEQVSWEDATEFCKRLSNYTHRRYRLPSEAEWEYACRAGTHTPFHFGPTLTTDYANYRGQDSSFTVGKGTYGPGSMGQYRETTTPVDAFAVSNAFGLFDMHGNVWEWCQDSWHKNYEGNLPTDGTAWEKGGDRSLRVLRGGSWNDFPRYCRSAYRNRDAPGNRNYDIGFRVVVSTPRTDKL